MDRARKPNKFVTSKNDRMYMDLKDIIKENALPFLPAKSLFRCIGVCKDWKLHITSPFFAHNQTNSFSTVSGFFCQSYEDPPSFHSLDNKSCGVPDPSLSFLPVPVCIKASSSGIICCQGKDLEKQYYICNPVTKQWKTLPTTNTNHGQSAAIVLIFKPSLLDFVADYKLICAFPSADFDDGHEFEIYSSAEGIWKMCGEICFGNWKIQSDSGVYVDGVVYWLTNGSVVLAYDIAKDRSRIIRAYCPKMSLGVMNGKLCMAYLNGLNITVNVLSNVYSNTMGMNSRETTWKEKFRFTLDNLPHRVPHSQQSLVFINDDVAVLQLCGEIVTYDMNNERIEVLFSTANREVCCLSYVNSLVYL